MSKVKLGKSARPGLEWEGGDRSLSISENSVSRRILFSYQSRWKFYWIVMRACPYVN